MLQETSKNVWLETMVSTQDVPSTRPLKVKYLAHLVAVSPLQHP